jgi:hypothetical protein
MKPAPTSSRSSASPSPSMPAWPMRSSVSRTDSAMRLNRPKSRNAIRPSSSSIELPGCGSPLNCRWRYMQPK